jgi:hypothetical protein
MRDNRGQFHLPFKYGVDPEGVQQESPGRKPWELTKSKGLAL